MKKSQTKKILLALIFCTCAPRAWAAEERIENQGNTTIEITNETFNGLPGDGQTVTGGGAISNEGTISKISNSIFTGNNVDYSDLSIGCGGAIYNADNGIITSIEGSYFENNSVTNGSGGAINGSGGAIYNSGTVESIIGSSFTENSARSGGAIYNKGTITNIIENTFMENTASSGGAIYNNTGAIGSIKGSNFLSNNATTSGGGAIYNYSNGKIESISGSNFNGNSAGASGGAIENLGTINEISDSTFTGNSADSDNNNGAGGGAIYNNGGNIGSITGTAFISNEALGNNHHGGAIYNDSSSTIGSIEESTFAGNTAGANGGAIYNLGTIDSITETVFDGNSASAGGAIYNTGTIGTITNTSFYNNSASGNGGAIYSTKDLTIVADGADVVFSGNTADGKSNAIYMANSATKLTFSLSGGGSIYLYDSVSGEDGYSVDVSGDGTFYLLNDLEDAAFSIGNAVSPLAANGSGDLTLSTVDGEIRDYSMSSFALTSDINMAVDVDLANQEMDSFEAGEYDFGEGDDFSITITGINLISEGSSGIGSDTQIYFSSSGSGLDDHITIDPSAATAYTPMYQYAVSTGSDGSGLYFTFANIGYNSAVMASSVAGMAAYGAMNMMFNANFEHSDYFMKLPEEVRLAKAEAAKAQKSASKIKENDPRRLAYYNQNEMTERGAWFKSFYANESVSYRGGWDSRDKYYGGLVGFDTDLRDHGNGWAHLFTGYVGTIGIRQEYSGGHIKQHGGLVGVTGSFYRKNFYTAWTAAAGFTKAHEHTMYGHDTSKNDTWGVAGKFGWNFELAGGKFSLLPTFTASYTTVNPEDYTNAADVKFTGSGVRAVQLNPNVKFIMNAENGLQPYVTVGEVWTVGQSSGIKADGEKLPELEMKSYTEYGLGVQKRWADEKDAYVQLLGHSHGRDGFLINAGLRWNF